jgi:hypothetical protein
MMQGKVIFGTKESFEGYPLCAAERAGEQGLVK